MATCGERRLLRGARHPAALDRACATRLGAATAVLGRVPVALLRAGVARVRTRATDHRAHRRRTLHEARREQADLLAVQARLRAGHRLLRRRLEAGPPARPAIARAADARVDAGLHTRVVRGRSLAGTSRGVNVFGHGDTYLLIRSGPSAVGSGVGAGVAPMEGPAPPRVLAPPPGERPRVRPGARGEPAGQADMSTSVSGGHRSALAARAATRVGAAREDAYTQKRRVVSAGETRVRAAAEEDFFAAVRASRAAALLQATPRGALERGAQAALEHVIPWLALPDEKVAESLLTQPRWMVCGDLVPSGGRRERAAGRGGGGPRGDAWTGARQRPQRARDDVRKASVEGRRLCDARGDVWAFTHPVSARPISARGVAPRCLDRVLIEDASDVARFLHGESRGARRMRTRGWARGRRSLAPIIERNRGSRAATRHHGPRRRRWEALS